MKERAANDALAKPTKPWLSRLGATARAIINFAVKGLGATARATPLPAAPLASTMTRRRPPATRSWLCMWELYPIVLLTAFMRLYLINTTEFDDDQAVLFRLAHDAMAHGLLPVTSNGASISTSHSPGAIYFFLLPAALSNDPVWAAVMVGLFSLAAVVLTYVFTRRYYGRLAGTLAALLYTTAFVPLLYARFIWQPNLMPPFVLLFLFALFRGVIERRKGWLFPAIALLGLLYQLHEVTVLLVIPLLAAILLAPGTIRWRDFAFGLLSLLILFFPWLLWEVNNNFADLQGVFMLSHGAAHIDDQALRVYQSFLIPYGQVPTYKTSVLRLFAPSLNWLLIVMPLLTLCALLTVTALAVSSWKKRPVRSAQHETVPLVTAQEDEVEAQATRLAKGSDLIPWWILAWRASCSWWADLRATPSRCGLALLLIWQIVPVLILSRHAVGLHAQYFFMFQPGAFILVGFVMSKLAAWLWQKRSARLWGLLYAAFYPLLGLIIATQLLGSIAGLVDLTVGNFDDRGFYPYHNDLGSLEHALSEADQLAQQRHLNRVYITTDAATQTALGYLTEHGMQTPTTLFDAQRCLVLPNPANGPVVLLVGPYDDLTNALLSQFTTTTLVDKPPRMAGGPFRLYIVTPTVVPAPTSSPKAFAQHLQLLSAQAQQGNESVAGQLVTTWSLLQSEQPALRTTYSYELTAVTGKKSELRVHSICTFSAMHAGDQLLVAFNLPATTAALRLSGEFYTSTPYNSFFGPLHVETYLNRQTPPSSLQTIGGQQEIEVSVVPKT